MSRNTMIALLIVLGVVVLAIVLGRIDTTVAPRMVEKDMLNAAAPQ